MRFGATFQPPRLNRIPLAFNLLPATLTIRRKFRPARRALRLPLLFHTSSISLAETAFVQISFEVKVCPSGDGRLYALWRL